MAEEAESATPMSDIISKYLNPQEETPYFAAIGKFIVEYARAEAAFHRLACSLLNVGLDKSSLIFSGMRFPDLVIRIKGMLALENISKERKGLILSCLAQMDVIGTKRHYLVHRWVTYESQQITVTNIMTARTFELVENISLSLDEINFMRDDCMKIYFKIIGIAFPGSQPRAARYYSDWLDSPWQYKPEMPIIHKTKPHKIQKPKGRLPPSSQE